VGATEKYSRYRWEQGREKDLWLFVDDRVKGGASVTAALKEYGKKHSMSWLTARWKYYQLRKQGLQSAASIGAVGGGAVPLAGGPFTEDEEDFLGYLAEFISSTRDSGQDVVPFIRGLSRLAALSREGARLKEELERSRSGAREGAEALAGLCHFLEDWLRLPQVDRVGSLKDFSERLGAELGKLASLKERLANA
jgi:hypothetical protein